MPSITKIAVNKSMRKVSAVNRTEQEIVFGTDGWRGVIGETFTFANARRAADAVARAYEPDRASAKTIYVGYDHRFLAERFAQEVAGVLCAHGFDARVVSQPVTSPLLSYFTWKSRAPFGVMMTASHNPPEYLGLKVKGSFGGSIPQETVRKIEQCLETPSADFAGNGQSRTPLARIPKADDDPLLQSYFDYLNTHLDTDLFKKGKAVITLESLYGPGGKVARIFLQKYKNIRMNELHFNRDPLFGGLHPEPIEEYLSELKTVVPGSGSDAGFALDGDGDRLGVTDEKGAYLTPQQVFALLLRYLAGAKKLRGKVVQTVSLGYLSERIAADYGLQFEEVPVGFKYVADKLLNEAVMAGGEESGGYAFSRTRLDAPMRSLLPERDGFFSAMLFLEMILSSGKPVSVLLREIQSKYGQSHYLRKDIPLAKPVRDKSQFVKKMQSLFPANWLGVKVKEMRSLDGLKIVLADGSWLLMRPSGTEPLLRTYAEFPDSLRVAQSIRALSEMVEKVL